VDSMYSTNRPASVQEEKGLEEKKRKEEGGDRSLLRKPKRDQRRKKKIAQKKKKPISLRILLSKKGERESLRSVLRRVVGGERTISLKKKKGKKARTRRHIPATRLRGGEEEGETAPLSEYKLLLPESGCFR